MGVDLEKKRKLLLYPIEYQRGPAQIWGPEVKVREVLSARGLVLEFARVGDYGQRGAKPLSKCVICQHNR